MIRKVSVRAGQPGNPFQRTAGRVRCLRGGMCLESPCPGYNLRMIIMFMMAGAIYGAPAAAEILPMRRHPGGAALNAPPGRGPRAAGRVRARK